MQNLSQKHCFLGITNHGKCFDSACSKRLQKPQPFRISQLCDMLLQIAVNVA